MLCTAVTMLFLLLQLLPFAAAQDTVITSSTSSAAFATPTTSVTTTSAVTHTIDVAKGGFTFVPDITLANVGDYIEFDFFPTNHSVVRAEYGYPCIPYEDTGVDKIGFFSGFRPVDAIISDPPTFTIEINDTNPTFFYCSAPGSCIGYGMVGVINPNASTSLVTQRQLARNSTFMLQPGEAWPSEGPEDPFTTTATTVATTTTATATATSSSSPTASASAATAKSSSSLSGGAIAGIAIGGAAVVLIAAALLYFCGRRSRRARHDPPVAQQPNQPYSPQTFSYAPQSPQQPYPSSGFSYMPHMSEQKAASDVTQFSGTQRFSSPPPGYVPAHDSYREAGSAPIHEM